MSIWDFLIGLTLMNAMPHFVLGVWKGRMLSGFGVGNNRNKAYSVFNATLSLALFWWQHGWQSTPLHGVYYGALFTLICYYLLGRFFYQKFHIQ